MKTQLITHKLANSPSTYDDLIRKLKSEFSEWKFTDMGGISRYKQSTHFHIAPRDSSQKGVIEITMSPQLSGKIEIKLASNRTTTWSTAAFQELIRYLKD